MIKRQSSIDIFPWLIKIVNKKTYRFLLGLFNFFVGIIFFTESVVFFPEWLGLAIFSSLFQILKRLRSSKWINIICCHTLYKNEFPLVTDHTSVMVAQELITVIVDSAVRWHCCKVLKSVTALWCTLIMHGLSTSLWRIKPIVNCHMLVESFQQER